MNLKEAYDITKSFSTGGVEYTPAVSDDWELVIRPSYVAYDKIILKSKKLSIEVPILISVYEFFLLYIESDLIVLNQNKLIGSYAFSKKNIYSSDKFNEAKKIIESNDVETIPNNDLIQYGLYLDKKGDIYLYLGNFSYFTSALNKDFIFSSDYSSDKRYIVKFNKDFDFYSKMIQKNSNHKFISFKRVLTTDEITKLYRDHFTYLFYNISIFSKKGGNQLNILKKKYNDPTNYYYSINLCYFNGVFGNLSKVDFTGEKTFQELDFDKFSADIYSNSISKVIDEYALSDIKIIKPTEKDSLESVYFFLDYI